MEAFAQAVADGDYERAEGWLAVARFSTERTLGTREPAGADALTR